MASGSPYQRPLSPEDAWSGTKGSSYTMLPQAKLSLKMGEKSKNKLPQVLNTRDLTVFMLLIVVFISNNNALQSGGPSVFIYWFLGLLTFLLPSAYVTQWLGKRLPGQGAPYLWATRLLGHNWSLFVAFCAWWPGVLSIVSAIEAGILFLQYLVPTWFTRPWEQGLVILAILLLTTTITSIPLRYLRYILLVFVVAYMGVFVLLGGAAAWWLWSGHTAVTSLNISPHWLPSGANFNLYGLIILALLGVDVPLFLGGELKGGRIATKRATNYVWWGSAIAFLVYLIGTLALIVIIPPDQSSSLNANANILAIQLTFGTTVSTIVTIILILSQIGITIAYLLMFSRLLVVTAQDGRLPVALAKVNRQGVPVVSIVTQAAIIAVVTILALIVIPVLFEGLMRPEDLANDIYNLLLAGAAALWGFSTILLFVFALWFLYRSKRHTQRQIKQKLVMWGIAMIGAPASVIGIWATISSSWIPSIPNDRWMILTLGIIAFSLIIGWVSSDLPRVHALLREQKQVYKREMVLRQQLQSTVDEQEILVQQQQMLLEEVDRLYKEQAQAAITDIITGLPNHRAVMTRIEEEVSRCRREGTSCAILFIDLDHFKHVNDTLGHRAGDEVLHQVGQRLRSALRLEDFVGRYGGEEFAVVLTNADLNTSIQTAERLRAVIGSEPFDWQMDEEQAELPDAYSVPVQITVSIGVAVFQLHGNTPEKLIEYADQAMYQAKNGGRNRVCIADVEIDIAEDKKISPHYHNRTSEVELVAIQALTAAASARDQGTDAHAHRMVYFAEATAQELQLCEEEVHLTRLAALFHDIGKIGIPDAILHKPGPLSESEWTIMREHPEIGHKILEQVGGVFSLLADIVVAHHERWDGKGYPRGLAKEAIPITSRILAVVDAFDAMTSRRAYREPRPVTEARIEIQRCSGTQFDPSVVEAFLQVLDDENQHIATPSGEVQQLSSSEV